MPQTYLALNDPIKLVVKNKKTDILEPDEMNSLHELKGKNLVCWCVPPSVSCIYTIGVGK